MIWCMETGVSIIIPTCDRPETLERALRSAINQTIPANVVVVNDGRIPIVAITGVTVVSTPHPYSGPSVARNIGVRACNLTCTSVCYLDDDDELMPDYVATQSSLLGDGSEFGFSTALFKYPDDSETTDPEPSNKGSKNYYDPNALLRQNIAPVSSFIHTSRAWSKIGGWDEGLLRMEDWDFWGRMFIACGPPSKTDKVTNIIYKGGSVSRSDYNPFAYAMSCHWRDIVQDRLRYLSCQKRGMVQVYDPLPKIPPLTIVASACQDCKKISSDAAYFMPEIIIINPIDSPCLYINGPKNVRYFYASQSCNTVTRHLNFGLILSRSKYVWVGHTFWPEQLWELENDVELYLVASSGGICMRRAVLERIGGLEEDAELDEAMRDFTKRAAKVFKVKEVLAAF